MIIIMIFAAKGGHIDIIKAIFTVTTFDIDDYEDALNFTAEGGQEEIVDLMSSL